ncbi:kinesin-like protein Klp10A isoform X2 [Macrosteles quadrilineatus]|uniref:kinesin-like protein Klp10A isoform X2 n=1 Tax=Macrosteles quadrilineatus TaxID=74068 RepID=UPI0023E27D23|nr:kinesin-like protein Klp10A isoform X2 [Macrosteles quadrilineatus]
MDEDFSAIKSGISVDIKRTDGRVHPAVVSGVNQATRCVTVEWFEHGETKGKEIEIEAILALNLHLAAGNYNNQNAVPNNQGYPLARYSTKASIPIVNNKGSYRSNKVQSRPTTINSNSVNGHLASEVQSVPPTPTIPVATATRFTNNMAPNNTAANNAANNAAAAAAARKATSRQSNVVKEVEKLKKNREERRQRQAELKEEKEALMNIDPGNPNWEFLGMIRNYRANIDFRPIKDTDPVEDHQITVCVRKRPLNKKEVVRKEVDVISVPSRDQIIVHEPRNKVDLTKYLENQHFRFDYAFDDTCSNEIVYKFTAKPLVQTIFDGGMATCFAYGQTGSGKTHTMGGDFNGKTQDCKKGIYAMAAKDVFKFLKSPQYKPLNLVVSASFFEIYSGKVFDLLADKSKLRVLEDGNNVVQIVGLTEKIVDSVEEVLKLIQHGNTVRTSGQTSANSNSSRSHAVFQILLRPPGMNRIHGKFSLIDLAGNERGADTSSANRQTRMEGAEINKSLLALKECIRALGRKGAHLPFRVSKLTQVLRDSFIGDKSKTCMIAMISPGLSSCEHSLNTLRYADRVKELAASDPTEPKSNSSPDDEQPQRPRHNNSGGSEVFDDDDLATLRSLNEGEISAEMMTFHEAVSQLQLLEEDVLETHKGVLDCHASWQQRHAQLLNMARDVDYDQDAYSKQLRNLLVEEIEVLKQILEKNDQFRVQLVNEEQISQKMKHPQHLGYN